MSRIQRILILFGATIISFLSACQKTSPVEGTQKDGNTQNQILLIGTFHYNNPGADVVKTKSFDILSPKAQNELDDIVSKIEAFNPTQIFVEWEYDEQSELDSLYRLYQQDTYFDNPDLSNFYRKNEIFQLGFRAAKSLDLDRVIGIDYTGTDFPFDSLMTVVATSGQTKIQAEIQEMIQEFTTGFDRQIESGASLIELTKYLNTEQSWRASNHFHCEIPLLVGPVGNFIGPFLTAEWFRRNLYMWSLVKKGLRDQDQRIMILVGASHAAMFNDFINRDPDWSKVGFTEIMFD